MLLRLIPSTLLVLFSLQLSAQRLPEKLAADLGRAGFNPQDLSDLVVKDQYGSTHNGLTHTYYRQRWQGIEVWNGDIAVHTLPNGEVVKVNNGAFSALEKRVNATEPAISPEEAIRSVLASTLPGTRVPERLASEDGGRKIFYSGAAFSGEPVVVQLVYQPRGEALLLAWNVNHYTPDGSHWWNVRVDAMSGEELDRNDWVVNCGPAEHEHGTCEDDPCASPAPAVPNDYNIYPWPVESPIHGSRAIRNAPWTAGGIASPYGWHDTNGAAGAEYTDTRGNNCFAQDDADANNTGGTRPSGGANLDFDFTLDLSGAPSTYLNVATTNLYYWNNIIHDVWYQYGFNEPAGNFQENNYGRGGTGSDPVDADAQDGSGTNNANFGTPPDGSNPRMQMFRWTYTTPNRDSDLDNGIIAHEYGHGISNRLVGGPSNTSCLGNAEQMGEGWSDYFGMVMTIEPGDLGTDGRGVGTYVLGQPTTGVGIRPARYSTSFAVNNYTYANTNSGLSQPHGIGFVWCTMLWEMTWELINVHGFDPDLYNGDGGNNIAMQLVIDGLKLTPCNPGFVQARDAILQADMINNAGANQNYIWAAFARRGLGVSASQGSSSSRSDQVEAFDTPLPINVGIASVTSPAGSLLDCATTNMPVTVTVRNYGQSAQSNFEVRYQLDGGPWVSEIFTGTLASGASAIHTFLQPVTITGNGAHTLIASTNLAGDQFAGNDAATSNISVSTPATVAAPFLENIETTSPIPSGWALQNPDNGSTWVTAAVSGQSACVGTRAWAIDFYSINLPGQEDRLVTPLVDLSASAGTHLKFDHAYSGYSTAYNDGFRVEISANCGLTWTTVFQAVGNALRTVPYSTNAWTPTACSDWLPHDIDISAFDGADIIVRFVAINAYGNWLYLDNAEIESNGVKLSLKLMLEGAYDENTDRMRDDLRNGGLVPTAEPYTALGFTQAGNGGGETINAGVLTTTGDNAIVDWVHVQLRDNTTPSTIVATRCALVQRDGDVVDKDGTSPVTFLAGPGSYHVAVRHRNHMGAMTSAAVTLAATTTGVDMTNLATATYGTEALKTFDGQQMLWAGNVLIDGTLRYVGEFNDRDPILTAIGGSVPTNISAPGYYTEDVNMDGIMRYVGSGNDRDPILTNVGGSVPTSTRAQQLP